MSSRAEGLELGMGAEKKKSMLKMVERIESNIVSNERDLLAQQEKSEEEVFGMLREMVECRFAGEGGEQYASAIDHLNRL